MFVSVSAHTEDTIMHSVRSLKSVQLNDTDPQAYEFLQDYELDTYPDVLEINVVPLLFLVIMVTGVFGNSLVIYVFARNKTYRTVTNIFLLNLAVVDLVYLCFCCPFTTANIHLRYWPFGTALCKTVSYLMVVCMSVNVMTLIAIGLDRYAAILYPVRSMLYRNRRNTIIIIITSWLVSFGAFIPLIRVTRVLRIYDTFCIEEISTQSRTVYTIIMLVVFYVVPQLLLAYCYTQIALRIRSNMRTTEQKNQVAMLTLKIRGRIIKMTFVVTLAFAICWLPLHIAAIMRALHVNVSMFSYYLQIFSPCFAYATVSLNPIIYCFMSKTFRVFLKAAFTCKRARFPPPLFGADVDLLPQNNIPRRLNRQDIELSNMSGVNQIYVGKEKSTWNSLNQLEENSYKMEDNYFTQELLIDKECQTERIQSSEEKL